MNPELIHLHEARTIAGISVRTSNARERETATAELPTLWARFLAAESGRAAEPAAAAVYGVYTEYESDADGDYTAIVGREGDGRHRGERSVIVPAGRYLVFTSTGEMPAAVLAGWHQVWTHFARSDAPRRSYMTDFEYYDPVEPSTVRIHIAVRDFDSAAGM